MNIRYDSVDRTATTRAFPRIASSRPFLSAALAGGLSLALWACTGENVTESSGTERSFYVTKDLGLDTSYHDHNYGYTGVLGAGYYPIRNRFALLQFDLATASASGLKSARLILRTYGGGSGWKGSPVTLTARIYRIGSPWVEGTGNFFWFNDAWTNSGEMFFSNHGMPPYVESGSSNPTTRDGLSNWDRDIVRSGNLQFAGSSSLTLNYAGASLSIGAMPIPAKDDLVEIEIDVTEYARAAVAGDDHGFVLFMDETSENRSVNFATKEIGDGTLGPRLILTY